MTGPAGPRNNDLLPSHEIRTPLTRASARVNGKSQFDVWGAAIITHRDGNGVSGTTARQRQIVSQSRANAVVIHPT